MSFIQKEQTACMEGGVHANGQRARNAPLHPFPLLLRARCRPMKGLVLQFGKSRFLQAHADLFLHEVREAGCVVEHDVVELVRVRRVLLEIRQAVDDAGG